MAFFSWIVERLKEPSSWYAITVIATDIGINIDPSISQQIASIGAGVFGLIAFISKEKNHER